MLRILIMCLLGLSGIFLEVFAAETPASSASETSSGIEEAPEATAKSKRHGVYPCDHRQSHQFYGSYLPPAVSFAGHYQTQAYHRKPVFVVPSYQEQHVAPKFETIGYRQKSIEPKTVYQVIQKPASQHAAYDFQPLVKPQIQYIHQPVYAPPAVKQLPISYVKSVAAPSATSYNNVGKLIAGHAKPVQYIPQLNNIWPVKTNVKQISYDSGSHSAALHPTLFQKPSSVQAQSYYPKQYFQPVSYYQKPAAVSQPISVYLSSAGYMNKYADYSGAGFVHQKQSTIGITQPIADCEKPYQPGQVSYVKIQQPVVQQVHQPILQYAAKYQQPMIRFVQKVHQPVMQQQVYHFAPKYQQPIVASFAPKVQNHQTIVHPAAPKIQQPIAQHVFVKYAQQPILTYGHADHGVNYQSQIVAAAHQPCHK